MTTTAADSAAGVHQDRNVTPATRRISAAVPIASTPPEMPQGSIAMDQSAWCGKELGHIALHEPDDVLDLAALACRGQKEVEAESVAFLVTSANGMDTSAYSFAYVAGWAQQAGGDIEATLADTATRALGAAHRILDRLDRDNPAALPVAEDAVPFEISGPLRAAPVPSAPADHSRHPTPSPGAADIAQAHRGVGR